MAYGFTFLSFLALLAARYAYSDTCVKDDDLKLLVPALTKCLNPVQLPICAQREKYLVERLKSSLTSEEFFKKIVEMDRKLVIIGEWHWNDGQNYLSSFLEKLHTYDPKINCLFLEFPSKFHKSLRKKNWDQKLSDDEAILAEYKKLITTA